MNTKKRHGFGVLALVVVVAILIGAMPVRAGSRKSRLPAAVQKTLKTNFPGARIEEVEREREEDVRYYELELEWRGREVEVEIAPDGAIGEIEEEMVVDSLPAAVAAKVRLIFGKGKVREIEKHEIRGVPLNGTFAQLAAPQIVYEIEGRGTHGARIEVRLDQTGKVLPDDDDNDDDIDDDDDDDDDDHDDDDDDDDDDDE